MAGNAPTEQDQFCKLFIGNLSYNTTEEDLQTHFGQFGQIANVIIVRHVDTKKSRGFGFITFDDPDSVDTSQAKRPHTIDGRQVESKRAMPREESAQGSVNKCFVGGLKEDIEEDHLQNYFAKFGKVENVHLVTDRETGKKKGFAFVTFDDYDPVDKLVLMRHHEINTHTCEVKKAFSKQQQYGRGGGRGGGMRGGRGSGYSGGDRYGYGGGGGGYYDNYGGGWNQGGDGYSQGWNDGSEGYYEDSYNGSRRSGGRGGYSGGDGGYGNGYRR